MPFLKTVVGERWQAENIHIEEDVAILSGDVAKTYPTVEDWSGATVVVPLHRVQLIWKTV